MNHHPPLRQRGFSLLEMCVAMVVLSVVILNTGVAILNSCRSNHALRCEERVFSMARRLLDRVASQPWGSGAAKPTAGAIERLFTQLDRPVPVTLMQLATAQPLGTWSFRVDDFDTPGLWSVVVDHDLNSRRVASASAADGAVDSVVMRSEPQSDLIRIVVRFDGCDIISMVRSREH